MKKFIELFIERLDSLDIGFIVLVVGGIALIQFIIPPSSLSNPNVLITLVALMTGIMSLYVVFSRDRRISKRRDFTTKLMYTEQMYSEFERAFKSITRTQQTQLTGAIEQKKEKWLNVPNISFHFADKEKIINFYNDYFKEPTVEQVVNELVGEVSGEIKGKIPQVIESKVGGKDISKWISTIKLPDISTAEMFRRWQRETIKNGQIILGLELVDIDLSDLEAFDTLLSQLKSKFDFQLEEPQVNQHRAALKRKAAENTIRRLETATGMILVEGKFKITDLSSDFYKCIYDHPVNEYVADEGKSTTISIILKKDALEPSIAGNYVQSIGKSIPLTVYGKIWQPVDRKENVWELQITPIAVY
jgi:hypothetical protein